MKSIFVLAVLLGIISTCLASVDLGVYANEKYPGKCYISENVILAAGTKYNHPNKCVLVICGENSWAETQTCGTMAIETPAGCHVIPPDLTLDYPECCKPKIVCSNSV